MYVICYMLYVMMGFKGWGNEIDFIVCMNIVYFILLI